MEQNDFFEGYYSCTDDLKADELVEAYKELRDEHMRLKELRKAKIDIIKQQDKEADEAFERKAGLIKASLDAYLETVKCHVTKTTMSYKLAAGKLERKRGGVDYKYNDEELKTWVLNNKPLMLKTETSVKWGELKKEIVTMEDGTVCTQDGEIIDCITAEMKPDTFDIKY